MFSLIKRNGTISNEAVKGFVDTTFPQLTELPEEQQNEALKLLHEKLFAKRQQDMEERQRRADELIEENNRIKKLSTELS
jgi:hypothetical protein